MNELKIGQKLWHPMSMDIIPHEIISKTEYTDRVIYKAKALGPVGACGRVEVELAVDRKGAIHFIGLACDYEYDGGLQDFVEGQYYTVESEAKKEFYLIQKTLIWSNMEEKKRLYQEAKKSYERCIRILETL